MLKLLFKRPTLGLISWLLLISFYLATFLNIAFYKQVLQDLPLDSVRNVLVFLSMPVVAFSVMNIVLTLASFLWLNRLVACIFILVGASAQYFIMTYGIIIDATTAHHARGERHSGRTYCLLGKNQTDHVCHAQHTVAWREHSDLRTADRAGRCVLL